MIFYICDSIVVFATLPPFDLSHFLRVNAGVNVETRRD